MADNIQQADMIFSREITCICELMTNEPEHNTLSNLMPCVPAISSLRRKANLIPLGF